MPNAVVVGFALLGYATVVGGCGGSSSSSDSRTFVDSTTASTVSTVAKPPRSAGTTGHTAPSSVGTASTPSSSVAPSGPTAASELSVEQQAAAYELVIRDAFMRSENDRPPDIPGVWLVDHPIDGAGRVPLSIPATATGEPFAADLIESISRRLADVPMLGTAGSMREVLGPDYHPTAPQTLRPGVLVVVSPITDTAGGSSIGVQVGPPGGAGWQYIIAVTGATATIIDAQMTWIS